MFKCLWMIFGLVLIVGLLVFLFIFFYFVEMCYDLGVEKCLVVVIIIDSFKE